MASTRQQIPIEELMVRYTFHPAGADAHPFDVSPEQLERTVLPWCDASGYQRPDLRELRDHLTSKQYSFAPLWLRLCSAVARNDGHARYFATPPDGTLDEVAILIY